MDDVKLQVRELAQYDEIMNKIGELFKEYECSYIETFGILEAVKSEFIRQYNDLDENN